MGSRFAPAFDWGGSETAAANSHLLRGKEGPPSRLAPAKASYDPNGRVARPVIESVTFTVVLFPDKPNPVDAIEEELGRFGYVRKPLHLRSQDTRTIFFWDRRSVVVDCSWAKPLSDLRSYRRQRQYPRFHIKVVGAYQVVRYVLEVDLELHYDSKQYVTDRSDEALARCGAEAKYIAGVINPP
jgi:hypothetical protein